VHRLFAGTFALLLPALSACASASPNEQGGTPRFDAGAPQISENEDGGDACGSTAFDAAEGTGWSDLYRDYFGPTAVSSCSGTAGQCHGVGGVGTSAWTCGATVASCYQGITNPADDIVTVGDTTDDPTTSTLYVALRKQCGGGTMPKAPATFVFSASDMKRITDWIGAGAPND
jgi:hypothetical protein